LQKMANARNPRETVERENDDGREIQVYSNEVRD